MKIEMFTIHYVLVRHNEKYGLVCMFNAAVVHQGL